MTGADIKMPELRARRPGPMVLERRFLPMWTAFALGAFADNMLRQALIIGIPFGYIAFAHGGGDAAVPVIGALFAVAMLVFSPLAGQVADRNETAMMFRRTKFAELLIMAVSAIGFLVDNGLLLVFSLFAMATQSAFFSPARIGAMPKYFDADELIRANAYFNAALFVSILVGLMIGGALITTPGGGRIAAAVLFFAALAGWGASLLAPPAEANAPGLAIDWNLPRQALRIAGFAFSAPGVARPLLGAAFFFFATTNITVLTPLYVRDALVAPGWVANAVMGLFAIGAGLGAWSASLWSKGRSGLGLAAAGVAASAVLTLIVVAATPAAAAGEFARLGDLFARPAGALLAAALTLSAAMMGLFLVPLQAAMQRRAPPERRARIMAASNMANAAAAMAGSFFALAVTQTALTPANAFAIIAALEALVALYMWRRWRRAPAGLHDRTAP